MSTAQDRDACGCRVMPDGRRVHPLCKAPEWCGTVATQVGPGMSAKLGVDYWRGWTTEIYCSEMCRDLAQPQMRDWPASGEPPDMVKRYAAKWMAAEGRLRLAENKLKHAEDLVQQSFVDALMWEQERLNLEARIKELESGSSGARRPEGT